MDDQDRWGQESDERAGDDWLQDESESQPRGFGGPAEPDARQRRPPAAGMSPMLKILVVLGILAVVSCCVCCGLGFYWMSNQQIVPREDEALARTTAREILGNDVPEQLFRPTFVSSMDLLVFKMRMVICQPVSEGTAGAMLLIEMQLPDNVEMRGELEPSLNQQQVQHSRKLDIESSETRTFQVRGEDVDFRFAKGIDRSNNKVFHEVEGLIPTPAGIAKLIIQIEADGYDETQIVEFLESLK